MATKQEQEVELDPELDPATSEVTRPSDLGFPAQQPTQEIEVEALRERVAQPDETGWVEIRMAKTIEEFTYGNPHRSWRLDEGKRYRVPVEIANYLYHLGGYLALSN